MTTAKIYRALEKAADTAPRNAGLVSCQFMDELFEKTRSEDLGAFAAGFYCASPGDGSEEKLVLGWLAEARDLKRQLDGLVHLAACRAPLEVGLVEKARKKYGVQYRAELRKLAERIFVAMEEHNP
jgi:hypothetical protein